MDIKTFAVLAVCVLTAAGLLSAADETKANPERIVCLAPNLTEIAFALGLEEKIAAVSSDSDYPAGAAEKEKVGTFWQPNTEAIIAVRPDLVITLWFEQQRAAAESLERLDYKVLTLRIEKIEELTAAIKEMGKATGREEQADELAKNIEEKLNKLKSRFDSADRPKVLWVIQLEPLRVAGTKTFVNELLELAGGQNAIGDTLQQYPPIGSEDILTCGAEVIVQSAMGEVDLEKQQKQAEEFWARYPNLPAVKEKRVYVIEPDTVLRLGPRLPDGVEIIAEKLHPDYHKQEEQK